MVVVVVEVVVDVGVVFEEGVVVVEGDPPLGASPYPSPRPITARAETPTTNTRPRTDQDYGDEFKIGRGYAEFKSEVQ
jgi:hypothetical protein